MAAGSRPPGVLDDPKAETVIRWALDMAGGQGGEPGAPPTTTTPTTTSNNDDVNDDDGSDATASAQAAGDGSQKMDGGQKQTQKHPKWDQGNALMELNLGGSKG